MQKEKHEIFLNKSIIGEIEYKAYYYNLVNKANIKFRIFTFRTNKKKSFAMINN